MPMATIDSSHDVSQTLSWATSQSDQWHSAAATVRFELPGVEPFTLDPGGRPTTDPSTHVFRLDTRTLFALTEGELTFLRAVTARKIHALGPIMTTFAIGQALQGLGPIR
jgi:hypothetical protein